MPQGLVKSTLNPWEPVQLQLVELQEDTHRPSEEARHTEMRHRSLEQKLALPLESQVNVKTTKLAQSTINMWL